MYPDFFAIGYIHIYTCYRAPKEIGRENIEQIYHNYNLVSHANYKL